MTTTFPTTATETRRPLHDGWSVRSTGGPVPAEIAAATVPATVPGLVHTDLLAAGLIPDPYLDRNEQKVTWIGESDWRWHVENPSSGAYGIPQSLPGRKMATMGADWRTNPVTQITWAVDYIKKRYGSPCEAWDFKRSHGWY